MKKAYLFFLYGILSCGIGNSAKSMDTNVTTSLVDLDNIDISHYWDMQVIPDESDLSNLKNADVSNNEVNEEQQLITDACDQWIFARRMACAGKQINNDGWINGCIHNGKYESWNSTFNEITKMIKSVLSGHKYSFANVDWNRDPEANAIRNAMWMQNFILLAVESIRNKDKNETIENLKQKVLDKFYDNQELLKHNNTLHDMHSYIDGLDVFNMITTTMRLSMIIKKIPEYEKTLNYKVKPIKQNNGHNNCYEASLLQIVNALDPNQIDDCGLKKLINTVSVYNNKHEKILDPRTAFESEYQNILNVYKDKIGNLVDYLKDKFKNQTPQCVATLFQSYNEFKNVLENNTTESPELSAVHNAKLIESVNKVEKGFETKKTSKVLSQNIENQKHNIKKTNTEKPKTAIDTFKKVISDLCECTSIKGFSEKLSAEHKQVLNHITAFKNLDNMVKAKKQDSIGQLFLKITEYYEIYNEQCTKNIDTYYKKDLSSDCIQLTENELSRKIDEINPILNYVTNDEQTDINKMLCMTMLPNINTYFRAQFGIDKLVSPEVICNKIFYRENSPWMKGFCSDNQNNSSQTLPIINKNDLWSVKRTVSNRYLDKLCKLPYKHIIGNNVMKGTEVIKEIKNILSTEENIEIYGKTYKYQLPQTIVNELLDIQPQRLKSDVNNTNNGRVDASTDNESISDRLNKYGFTALLIQEIERDILTKYSFCAIKKYPKVIMKNIETYNDNVQETVKNNIRTKEFLPVITKKGKILIYRLRGFASHIGSAKCGHYNASIFDGIQWRTIDSSNTNNNFYGKTLNADIVFYVYQLIYSQE